VITEEQRLLARLAELDEERAAIEVTLSELKRGYIRHEAYRDWAVTRDEPFTLQDMADAFCKRGGVNYHLQRLIDRGIIKQCGKRGNAKVYRYVPPEGPGAAAEIDIARRVVARKAAPRAVPAVPGTGAGQRVTNPDVRAVLEAVERQGATWERGKGHYIVRLNGQRVGTVPVSPSDHRWKKNMATQLKRKGLKV
jgi:hypothetical protein